MIWIAVYGAAAIATVALVFFNRREPMALACAMMLLMSWAVYNGLYLIFGDDVVQYLPYLDVIQVAVVCVMLKIQFSWWKLALASLFGVQICAHVVYWTDPAPGALPPYRLILNITFLLQLVSVGGSGVGSLAIFSGPGMSDRVRRRAPMGSRATISPPEMDR